MGLTDDSITVISEVGSVHDGSLGNALRLIEVAAECGSDAVKFQTHLAESESLPDAPSPSYFTAESRIEYLTRTSFSHAQWQKIGSACRERGVLFISSPFALEAVEILEDAGVDAYKVASGEVTNTPLLEEIAGTGKPVLLSSGMSNFQELDEALDALDGSGAVTLMQCSSQYPCPPERVGLNVMEEMRERYGLPVGLSDHTMGPAAALAACALGAKVIEKHITFSRRMYGSDAPHSMEPHELAALVHGIREIEKILRNPVDKTDVSIYSEMKTIFEKSVVSKVDIPAGTKIEMRHLAFKKPGDGIPAARYKELLGRTVTRDLAKNQKLSLGDVS